MPLPSPLPDDPRKWDGWRAFNSSNPYERLCLDFHANPSHDLIEDHCRQLLIWWQKKLPLKNQPSNPLSQMLREGLDEAPRHLSEARSWLLDPEKKASIDEELRQKRKETALEELRNLIHFVLADQTLTPEEEQNLIRFGLGHSLAEEEIVALIDEELEASGAVRKAATQLAPPVPSPPLTPASTQGDAREDFKRMLKLTGLDSDEMTDDQRDAFVNMAENLGLDAGDAEDLIDEYLEEIDVGEPAAPVVPPMVTPKITGRIPEPSTPRMTPDQEREAYPNFTNSIGGEMLLIPSGSFTMGSTGPGAAPNEQPLTKVQISCFHISRYPVTNAQYEAFDPAHRSKRAPWADDHHPVVYVSHAEAIKFCQWLKTQEKRAYRLPTEAEWEYAARGTDGRIYPWGNEYDGGELANFADCNTSFAWSDMSVNDGYAHTSPVGSFPRGASPFGVEDMAGNVWEWCEDIYAPYRGREMKDPKGPREGPRRTYRGGSWRSRFTSLRATQRGFNTPNYSFNDLGFRVVCECR